MKARGTENEKGKIQIMQMMKKCIRMQNNGKEAKLKNFRSKNAKMHQNASKWK